MHKVCPGVNGGPEYMMVRSGGFAGGEAESLSGFFVNQVRRMERRGVCRWE